MSWFDILLVALIFMASLCGWRFRLIPCLTTFSGLAFGLAVGGYFSEPLGQVLAADGQHEPLLALAIAGALAFALAAVLAVRLQARPDSLVLRSFNRMGGAALGLGLGVLVLAAAITSISFHSAPNEWAQGALEGSKIAGALSGRGQAIQEVFAAAQPDVPPTVMAP